MNDRPAFEINHVVGFEETNLVGNVYYVNYMRWQGRCREMFIQEHAPDVIQMIRDGLALFTVNCSCEYLAEISAFARLTIRMRLDAMVQNRVVMAFEYWRQNEDGTETIVARGRQEIACMARQGDANVPTAIPQSLKDALLPYGANHAMAG